MQLQSHLQYLPLPAWYSSLTIELEQREAISKSLMMLTSE
jgi:hypothetical protein